MSLDLDDTRTAPPAAAKPSTSEPDFAETFVPALGRAPALDPHMWPGGDPVAARAAPLPPSLFYGFRIGSSAIVLLDAVAYIGRRPSAPRVVRGGGPRLVRVQSPTREVSATHLELRQVGSTIVVQDLKSTNGTRLGVPGLPVRTLRPGESAVVSVGTLIDIGDRNVIEVLPLQEMQ